MKKRITIFGLLGFLIVSGSLLKRYYFNPERIIKKKSETWHKRINEFDLRDADLIFQTSLSRQSKAIQLATKSKYSHCGLIYKNSKDYFVFEAVQPVAFILSIIIELSINWLSLRKIFRTKQILTTTLIANIASYAIGTIVLYSYSFR